MGGRPIRDGLLVGWTIVFIAKPSKGIVFLVTKISLPDATCQILIVTRLVVVQDSHALTQQQYIWLLLSVIALEHLTLFSLITVKC